MSSEKRRILINSFMKSLFNYCPLVWIFYSRTTNSKINHLHKRCLRLIYNDNTSSFKELLERDRLRCLSFTATRPTFDEIFSKQHLSYELRHTLHFSVSHVRSVYNGTESLSIKLEEVTTLKCF